MLRTQEAAEFGIGAEGIGLLCEAMCFDAIEVASATRASVWFFDNKGNMVCHRLVDGRDSRIQQGAIIPRAASEPYFKAAIQGLASITSDDTVPQDGDEDGDTGAPERTRLDLLLVDGRRNPAAVFRAERRNNGDDWSERDLKILRELAQALAWAIRKQCQRDADDRRERSRGPEEIVSARPFEGSRARAYREIGSTRPNISWLRADPVSDIRLPQPRPDHDQGKSGEQDRLTRMLSEEDGWEC